MNEKILAITERNNEFYWTGKEWVDMSSAKPPFIVEDSIANRAMVEKEVDELNDRYIYCAAMTCGEWLDTERKKHHRFTCPYCEKEISVRISKIMKANNGQ